FQAEDGIRDRTVTGVQTCALPISRLAKRSPTRQSFGYSDDDFVLLLIGNDWKNKGLDFLLRAFALLCEIPLRLLVVGSDDPCLRSEERRVGKEWRSGCVVVRCSI